MTSKTFGRWVGYAVVPILVLETTGIWFGWPGDADAYSQSWVLARALGWHAIVALCAALCVTPIVRLGRFVNSTDSGWSRELRRGLGIMAASAAFLHAAVAYRSVPGTREGLFETSQLRAGVGALAILCLLYLTSFRANVRRLQLGFWKELHRLAYAALAFATLHALLGAFTPLRTLLLVVGSSLVIGLLRLVPRQSLRSRTL